MPIGSRTVPDGPTEEVRKAVVTSKRKVQHRLRRRD